MSFFLDCLGASHEVGRSAFLLHTDKKIMFDYGIKIFGEKGNPEYPLELDTKPDFAVISHAHLDHSGYVPTLYKENRINWYATPPTRDLCDILWQDSMKIMGPNLPYNPSHFKKAMKYWNPILYNKTIPMGATDITMVDAGHISGAGMVIADYAGKRVCYTGDFKGDETHMHKGAEYIEDLDVLIIETTYARREHPPRKELEKKFIEEIKETIDNKGNVLLPAFAVGRTQELIAMVRDKIRGVPLFVDGMGRKVTDIYLKYPQYIKDAKKLRRCVKSTNMVQGHWQRKKTTDQPSIIITSAGMMNGGPVLDHLQRLMPKSKIIFTGYSLEHTNGWKLLNEGYVTLNDTDLEIDLPVEYMDFSAHCGRDDILNFIKYANPEKIVLVHGDECKEFEKELVEDFGYDAIAPKLGERINLSE